MNWKKFLALYLTSVFLVMNFLWYDYASRKEDEIDQLKSEKVFYLVEAEHQAKLHKQTVTELNDMKKQLKSVQGKVAALERAKAQTARKRHKKGCLRV